MGHKFRDKSGPKKVSGTFKSEEEALSVVKPTLVQVEGLLKDSGLPVYTWAIEKLSRWLVRLERGSRVDDRTLMWGAKPRDQIVREFDQRVKHVNVAKSLHSGSPEAVSTFLEVESAYKEKIGPESMFKPFTEDGPDKVAEVFSDKPPLPALKRWALDNALERIKHLFPANYVKSTTIDIAINGLAGTMSYGLDTTRNACTPFWLAGYKPNPRKTSDADLREYVFQWLRREALRLDSISRSAGGDYRNLELFEIDTCSQRTNDQKGPDPLRSPKSKRLVIACPKYNNTILGKTVADGAQAACTEVYNKKTGVPVFLGWETGAAVDKGVQETLEYAASTNQIVMGVDFSGFDKHMPPWLMWEVAKAVSHWMTPDARVKFLSILHADIYNSALITPDRIWQPCPSSIKSGSIFTSLIGSLCNLTIQLYGVEAGYYELDSISVMGDDAIGVGRNYNPDVFSHAVSDLGMVSNAEKNMYIPGCVEFLKRLHKIKLPGGIYSAYRLLGKLMSAESDAGRPQGKGVSWQFSYKEVQQLENAWANPYYEELVDFAKIGDYIHHLGADVPARYVAKMAGDYVEQVERETRIKPYLAGATGDGFESLLTNGVVRGEKAPPLGEARFKRKFGVSVHDVAYSRKTRAL